MSTIRESIIEAVGTGSRTVSAIAAAAQLTEKQVGDNLSHLKREGVIVHTYAGLELAPGQKMPVKNLDPNDVAPIPSRKPETGLPVSAQVKSGNGVDHTAPA